MYLGLRCRSRAGKDWKVDIWFVDEPERQPDLRHLKTIPPRLNEERTLAILRIKCSWAARPEYGNSVFSADIYCAVIDNEVRELDEFADWLEPRHGGREVAPSKGASE